MSEEQRGPQGAPEGRRDAGPTGGSGEGVLTLVCVTCGKEYYFEDGDPPEGMICERCGGHVFRDFFSPEEGDDAAQDFDDTTARDLDPDDAEGETMPGDVMDLNRD